MFGPNIIPISKYYWGGNGYLGQDSCPKYIGEYQHPFNSFPLKFQLHNLIKHLNLIFI